jgi:hypothetical protein
VLRPDSDGVNVNPSEPVPEAYVSDVQFDAAVPDVLR